MYEWRELRWTIFSVHQTYLEKLHSNKTCLSCMQAVPDYVLRCGHAFCDRCVRELGKPAARFESAWVLDRCFLCGRYWPDSGQVMRFKPYCAGVRILTLDGGGVRGIVELVLLCLVQKRMQVKSLLMKDCFDLIMGTSTGEYSLGTHKSPLLTRTWIGGLIALGLSVPRPDSDFTVFDMLDKFEHMAREAFSRPREGSLLEKLDQTAAISKAIVIMALTKSVYPSKYLRRCLQELFGDQKLFGPAPPTKQRSVRVAVTSVRKDGRTLCLLTNYNRNVTSRRAHDNHHPGDLHGNDAAAQPQGAHEENRLSSEVASEASEEQEERQWEGIEREDQHDSELEVWEAGLATAAAPFYFKPFQKLETKKDYLDGGLVANFPGEQALHEMSRIWATSGGTSAPNDPHLDIMVSVGTGMQQKEVGLPLGVAGLNDMFKTFIDNLDSGRSWDEFQQKPEYAKHAGRIFRLNTSLPPTGYIPLNDYRKMEAMLAHVGSEGQNNPSLQRTIEDIAGNLLASLFFFEPANVRDPIASIHHGAFTQAKCSGTLRVRLANKSPEMMELVRKVDRFWLWAPNSVNTAK